MILIAQAFIIGDFLRSINSDLPKHVLFAPCSLFFDNNELIRLKLQKHITQSILTKEMIEFYGTDI